MLYDVAYNEDGTIADFGPKYSDIPEKIKKQGLRRDLSCIEKILG